MENELYHYNIPGSHWGVRRFQNKDGTLTPAGKERYSKANAIETAKRVFNPKNGVISEHHQVTYRPAGTITEKRNRTELDEYLRRNAKSMIRSNKAQPRPPHSERGQKLKLPTGSIEENPRKTNGDVTARKGRNRINTILKRTHNASSIHDTNHTYDAEKSLIKNILDKIK